MRLLVSLLAALLLTTTALAGPSRATRVPVRDGAWPLSPRPEVVQGFDPPATRWGAGHRGVDLLGHPGQRVHSALEGTVTFATALAGRGVVVVDHGGVRTTYEPVSASVSVGDLVGRDAVIGTLQRGSSHCLPRSCLHWGLLRTDAYLNPLSLVGAGPIRLLPATGHGAVPGPRAAPPGLPTWRPGLGSPVRRAV